MIISILTKPYAICHFHFLRIENFFDRTLTLCFMDIGALLSRPVHSNNGLVGVSVDSKETTKKITRNKFTRDEDQILTELIEVNGLSKGLLMASECLQRTVRQCKERWKLYLSPGIQTDKWTNEEDNMLMAMVKQYGKRWTLICQQFPKRTVVSLRNRYRQLFRHISWAFGDQKLLAFPPPDEKTLREVPHAV